MKGKVLPYPAEVKTETFSEKYDGPTARLTKSFETGDPMRKGCSNSNKGDYNFEALAASNQTIAYSPLTAVHENYCIEFSILSMESERRNPCAVVGESGDSGLYFSLFSWKFFAGLPFAEDFF